MSYGFLAPVLVVLLTVSPALADDDTDAKKQAAELAAKSAKHYKRGEFEQAAGLLRDAYARYPEPNLLYNLARALEGSGDREGAIEAYERFLRAGKRIEDRGGIERRVATLKAELAEQKRRREQAQQQPAEPARGPPSATPAVTGPATPPEPIDTPTRKRKLWPWVTIGGGVAIAAVGGVMAYRAGANEDKAQDAMSGLDAQTYHDRAKRDALIANILFGAGAAVVITGVVFVW